MKINKKIIYRIIKILFAILIFVAISLTNGKNRKVTLFEGIVNDIILVPQKIAHTFNLKIAKNDEAFEIEKLKDEIKELKNENRNLSQELTNIEATKSENLELKKVLNVKSYYDDKDVIVCDIVGAEINNWDALLIINKGFKDGIRPNAPVITKEGLVGYITTCSDNSAKIVTILDSTSTFSARATETREEVIVKGDIALKNYNRVKLTQIPIGVTYGSGDLIETSGIGGIYPKGISVGKVISFEKGINPLENTAIVETSVDFDRVEMVAVITNVGDKE